MSQKSLAVAKGLTQQRKRTTQKCLTAHDSVGVADHSVVVAVVEAGAGIAVDNHIIPIACMMSRAAELGWGTYSILPLLPRSKTMVP